MIYPNVSKDIRNIDSENLAIQTFGKRIHVDQTLYEFLLEFLLIVCSDKNWGDKPSFGFPKVVDEKEEVKRLRYNILPRMGLKRFVFFDRSKLENRFEVDKKAYEYLIKELKKHIQVQNVQDITADDVIEILQDLLYGFKAVIGNRAWFVQSLLPICPELIFCESMGKKQKRANRDFNLDGDIEYIDYDFEFNEHNFMARGGEVYYLHILQGLAQHENKSDLQEELKEGLKNLICSYPPFSEISNFIQNIWEDSTKMKDIKDPKKEKYCEWIRNGYKRRAKLACVELRNFLLSNMHPLQAMDILAYGIILHILRMMHEQAVIHFDKEANPAWIMDVFRQGGNIRKLSIDSYRQCEEDMIKALHIFLENKEAIFERLNKEETDLQLLREGYKDGHKLFRRLGKSIRLVIPIKGPNMRFTFSDNLVKFLVLSLIPPGEKLTFHTFTEKLYEHYRIIIGPNEYFLHFRNKSNEDNRIQDISCFDLNLTAFQELLKKCGFLRDLSDATSIVENPYGRI